MTVNQPDRWQARFDHSKSVAYVLDQNYTILYCNPAWDRFALANYGESCMGSKICGTPLFRYVPRVLEYHYSKLLERAREKHELVTADYECNSPDRYRKFRMHISPIPTTSLLAIEHPLIAHGDIPYPAFNPADRDYGVGELVTICAQCRRTKRLHDNTWDWVPAFLRNPPARIAHGICQDCLLRYCQDSQQ